MRVQDVTRQDIGIAGDSTTKTWRGRLRLANWIAESLVGLPRSIAILPCLAPLPSSLFAVFDQALASYITPWLTSAATQMRKGAANLELACAVDSAIASSPVHIAGINAKYTHISFF